MKFKISKSVKIGVVIFLLIILLVGMFFYKINIYDKDIKHLINIDDLSKEFMDNYFKGLAELNDNNNKDNILIVTSKKKMKDTYGATNVVEAPNNQFFLQYETEDDKNNALELLKNEKAIFSVEENIKFNYTNEEDNESTAKYNSWGVEAMGIDKLLDAFPNYKTNDINVAVLDSGLDVELFNENYTGKLGACYDATNNSFDIFDEVGHGTHIAGTIAESTPDNVKVISIRLGNDPDLISAINGINYVTYNKKASVMNMSFGGNYEDLDSLYIAIEAAKEQNIISVVAAGNDGSSDLDYPAAFDNTLTISAVDSYKEKAPFSNYGSAINFAAPGVNILSINGVKSGTSMATPHAVSAVAILKSMNENLTFDNIILLLSRYSEDIGDIGWDKYYGYGFINFKDAQLCDNKNCDEFNIFKEKSTDDLSYEVDNYIIKPSLTSYNYGTINNILNTKIVINYKNGKVGEYNLSDIDDIEISGYDSNNLEEQEINIKFTTSFGFSIDDSFKITNPTNYESVYDYNFLGDNNIELTGYKETSFIGKKLYIPETIDGYTVVAIADSDTSIFTEGWTSFENIQELYLPVSLTKIGNYAFCNQREQIYNGLKYVKSFANHIEVGDSAFAMSLYLETLDAEVSYVGNRAFKTNLKLKNITFTDDLTYIGDEAFLGGYAGSMTIPKNVTYIGNNAFNLSNLKEINFLNSYEKISDQMFQNCIYLKKVILPNNLKEIGNYAFGGCIDLKEIIFPDTLTKIGDYAFSYAFDKDADVKIKIPKSVKEASYAFQHANIKEVSFEKGTKRIPDSIFNYNSTLEKIDFNDDLEEIGFMSFGDCIKLKELVLPEGLVSIDAYAFWYAFDKDSNIEIVIPNSVKEIKYSAFENSNIEEIVLPNGLTSIDWSTFKNCIKLKNVTLPESLNYIGNNAFENTNIEEIILPNGLINISSGVFKNCNKLKKITLPESLELIGEYAFQNAFDKEANVKIAIPKNVDSILNSAFEDSNIKEIKFDTNKMVYTYDSAFKNIKGLEKVVLPEGIKYLENSLFEGCSSLKEIFLNKEIVKIADNAFAGIFQDAVFYVYNDTYSKTFVSSKNYNFRQINPDNVIIKGLKDAYSSFSKLNLDDIYIVLNYEEKELRTEIIDTNINVEYQNVEDSFRYGDTSVKLILYNELGYKIEKDVDVEVVKAIPDYEVPTGMTAKIGQTLSEIVLPEHFSWIDDTTILDSSGYQNFKAKYTPDDTDNYEIVDNIDITIGIGNCKNLIIPSILISDKVYDGTKDINIDTITISGIDKKDYTIISAKLTSENAGKTTAKIKLKLSDKKFEDYSFDNNLQEKEFIVDVNISKANSNIKYTSSENKKKYDGNYYGINLDVTSPNSAIIKYMDSNGEYILDEMPKYKELGEYEIRFRIYIDDNHFDIKGKETLIIHNIYSVVNSTTDYEGVYDEKEHTIDINVDIDDYDIVYSTDGINYNIDTIPKYKDVGEHQVYYKIIKDGYEDLLGSNYVKIYGIKKIDDSIKVKNNNLVIKDNDFNNLTSKFSIYANSKTYSHFSNNINVGNMEKIKTGDVLRVNINNKKDFDYNLSYLGDVNGDGEIGIIDYIRIMKDIMGTTKLSGVYYEAADMNENGSVDIIDYIRIMKIIMEEK